MKQNSLHPVLLGNFKLLGPSPQRLELPDLTAPLGNITELASASRHECVDHHVFQISDGSWHLWGCIRKTTVGRILYHWEGKNLGAGLFKPTNEIIRVSRDAGESLSYYNGEECIQSPFIVVDNKRYYMFYGGGGSGCDMTGKKVPAEDPLMTAQICLMLSNDGRNWTRYRNEQGLSRVFTGPLAVRDPCLLKIHGVWYMYYAGMSGFNEGDAGFYARTSLNLFDWSAPVLVHNDTSYGGSGFQTECPHVVMRGGYYFLFRTVNYPAAETYVFRSRNPLDFGVGDAGSKFAGSIGVAAPEIITDEKGTEYITSNHDLTAGTMLCRLKWVE